MRENHWGCCASFLIEDSLKFEQQAIPNPPHHFGADVRDYDDVTIHPHQSQVYDREDKKPTLADVAECAGAGGAKYTEYFSEGACLNQPQPTNAAETVDESAAETVDESNNNNNEEEEEEGGGEQNDEENNGSNGSIGSNESSGAIVGYVSDVQCTRKRTENKEFRTPDNDIDPLADLLEHTVNCLYEIPSCRTSGYDILADEGVVDEDGVRLYYAKYRMDAGLNTQMEALLKNTATEKGFRAKVVGATTTPLNDINGRAGFVLSGGTIEEAADSGTAAGSFASFYTADGSEGSPSANLGLAIGIVVGVTLALGVPFTVCMLRAHDAAASSATGGGSKSQVDPSNLIEMGEVAENI